MARMVKTLSSAMAPVVLLGLLIAGPLRAQSSQPTLQERGPGQAQAQGNAPPDAPRPVQNSMPARPGSINYVEGSASIDSQPLTEGSAGKTVLQKDQVLATQDGRVEMLL